MTAYVIECAADQLVDAVKSMGNLPPEVVKALQVYHVASIVDYAVDSDNHEDIDINDLERAVNEVDSGLGQKEYSLAITRWLFDNVIRVRYPADRFPRMTYANFLNRYWAKDAGVVVVVNGKLVEVVQ